MSHIKILTDSMTTAQVSLKLSLKKGQCSLLTQPDATDVNQSCELIDHLEAVHPTGHVCQTRPSPPRPPATWTAAATFSLHDQIISAETFSGKLICRLVVLIRDLTWWRFLTRLEWAEACIGIRAFVASTPYRDYCKITLSSQHLDFTLDYLGKGEHRFIQISEKYSWETGILFTQKKLKHNLKSWVYIFWVLGFKNSICQGLKDKLLSSTCCPTTSAPPIIPHHVPACLAMWWWCSCGWLGPPSIQPPGWQTLRLGAWSLCEGSKRCNTEWKSQKCPPPAVLKPLKY